MEIVETHPENLSDNILAIKRRSFPNSSDIPSTGATCDLESRLASTTSNFKVDRLCATEQRRTSIGSAGGSSITDQPSTMGPNPTAEEQIEGRYPNPKGMDTVAKRAAGYPSSITFTLIAWQVNGDPPTLEDYLQGKSDAGLPGANLKGGQGRLKRQLDEYHLEKR
ncbi:hypothetical protein T265_10515 [Opisthorchis viverrini]|uniref:Uncharacterized protein n=1 Tax=Opisthorchis viverrini TaxID=6198 RepID=A0A074ZCZ9_OPIVI|nr:hypothetical protein T265_10515 [Opisthorchis viverrini]KER21070.1 hypothetical protein T265_10515 [Opisthorchis viverrini]